jgi:phage tail sheath protein FI
MPEYLAPGVYVEEVPAGPVPIEGVGTTTTGFVGQTVRGPLVPQLVTGWPEFQRWYGGLLDASVSYLPFAVKGFFDNGGQRAFIARVTRSDARPAEGAFALSAPAPATQRLRIRALGPGAWGSRLFVRIADSRQRRPDPANPLGVPVGFRITVLYYTDAPPLPLVDPTDENNRRDPRRREPSIIEDWDNLRWGRREPNYVEGVVNAGSQLIQVSWADPVADTARPTNAPFAQLTAVAGVDGTAPIGAGDYQGGPMVLDPGRAPVNVGLAGIELIDEVALVCVPDEATAVLPVPDQVALREAIVNQCELLKDRFAVMSVPANQSNVANVLPFRDTSYAAIYYPWIRVLDTRTGLTLLVPPSGHVTGIYARTDIERGVHKAPANEVVRGILTTDITPTELPLEFKVTKGQQDILNPRGINVIRDFRADLRGIRVWGARTMSSNPQWKYVNVRRLFIFVEESIDQGTQWVVFEPNDYTTWARVVRSVTNFLTTVWRSGALMGLTAEEAFFVKCDRTTMSQDDIDNGRLIVLVGIAPVKPAEFVIFRISQKTAEAPA